MTGEARFSNHLLDYSLAYCALNSANDGITIVDMKYPGQPLIFINTAFEKMTGYKKSEILGKNCRFLQHHLSNQPEVAALRNAIKNWESCRVVLKNFKKDGSLFWNELSLAPIIDHNGQLNYYIGVQKDISKEILQHQRIAYLSIHDELTGLYNYRHFFEKVTQLMLKAQQENKMLGIGVADVDKFKQINDMAGHLQGNHVLKLLGLAITQEFRLDDIAARFGGDEFCFAILTHSPNGAFFYRKIARVMRAVNPLLTHIAQITMSSGIVIETVNELTNIDHLLNCADKVMYQNKQRARQHHKGST